MLSITLNNEKIECEDGSVFFDIVSDIKNSHEERPILVRVNGVIKELSRHIDDGDVIELLYFDNILAKRAYVNTAIYILQKAVFDAFKHKYNAVFRFRVNNGYYFEIENLEVGYAEIEEIRNEFVEIVNKKFVIKKNKYERKEALRIFEDKEMYDVSMLMTYNYKPAINIRDIDGYMKYVNGELTYDTSYIKYFDLKKYDDGLLLILPSGEKEKDLENFIDNDNLFTASKKSLDWATSLKIDSVGKLNKFIAKTKFDRVVMITELNQSKDIEKVAEHIISSKDKIVCIAGPSASGKTTFSHRLMYYLAVFNKNPIILSCDNFYKEWKDRPVDANGNIDHESLNALDIKLLNKTMADLISGKEVKLPIFHFDNGTRTFSDKTTTLDPDGILIIEGIHCLNPKLYNDDIRFLSFKIFLTPLPAITLDDNNRILSSDLRLIRRLVRDYMTRNHSPKKTMIMWDKVRESEEKWIFPFSKDADIVFNTSLIFELNLLKNYALPLLFDVADDPDVGEFAMRIAKVLNYFLGAYTDVLPNNSILREFIGGSVLDI